MKTGGSLTRNWPRSGDGDTTHADLSRVVHNLPLILAHLRVLNVALVATVRLRHSDCAASVRMLSAAQQRFALVVQDGLIGAAQR
jgi:hypothetical protein